MSTTILHQESCWEGLTLGHMLSWKPVNQTWHRGNKVRLYFLSPRFYFYSLGILYGLCW